MPLLSSTSLPLFTPTEAAVTPRQTAHPEPGALATLPHLPHAQGGAPTQTARLAGLGGTHSPLLREGAQGVPNIQSTAVVLHIDRGAALRCSARSCTSACWKEERAAFYTPNHPHSHLSYFSHARQVSGAAKLKVWAANVCCWIQLPVSLSSSWTI